MLTRSFWFVFGVAWVGVWTGSGCGGSASAPTKAVEAAPQTQAAPDSRRLAEEKYQNLCKDLEKLGATEKANAGDIEARLREILRLDGSHKAARFDLAALHELMGKDVAASYAVYEELAAQDPNFAPAHENLARRYVEKGEIAKAVALYERFIAQDKKNITSRLGLARIRFSEGNYDQAIDLCREVLQRQADALEAFRVLAKSYRAKGNLPMAELTIGRGLKVDPNDVEIHALLADVFLERDDLAAAIRKLKEVVRMAPNRLSTRAKLAGIAMSYRDFGNAAQQYEAILKVAPNDRATRLSLAVSYKGLGRYEQAEALYKKLYEENAKDADVLWNMGVLYHMHLHNYDQAIEMYRGYTAVAKAGDERAKEVEGRVAEIVQMKNDIAANKAKAEKEEKLRAAISAACQASASGGKVDAEAIGDEQDRIQAAWQLMVDGQSLLQNGDLAGGEATVMCAFAILPSTPRAATEACAPMRVMWTQLLYQLGRLPDALAAIKEGLKCDPQNPDAQLIEQQLNELIAQQANEAPPQTQEGAPAQQPAENQSGP